jgi:hypothetical protein
MTTSAPSYTTPWGTIEAVAQDGGSGMTPTLDHAEAVLKALDLHAAYYLNPHSGYRDDLLPALRAIYEAGAGYAPLLKGRWKIRLTTLRRVLCSELRDLFGWKVGLISDAPPPLTAKEAGNERSAETPAGRGDPLRLWP